MKFYIRRFALAVLTLPIILGAYYLLWALLIGLGATGTLAMMLEAMPSIAVAWVAVLTFAPSIIRLGHKLTD